MKSLLIILLSVFLLSACGDEDAPPCDLPAKGSVVVISPFLHSKVRFYYVYVTYSDYSNPNLIEDQEKYSDANWNSGNPLCRDIRFDYDHRFEETYSVSQIPEFIKQGMIDLGWWNNVEGHTGTLTIGERTLDP